MSQTENQRLFDITVALALYVESVKLGQMQEFNAVLSAVDEELHKTLSRVNYKTLDGLSKAELNRLLIQLRRAQFRIYSAYTEKFIASLETFMRLRLDVGAVAYASAKHSFDNNGEPFVFDEPEAFDYIKNESAKLPFSPMYGLGAIAAGSVSLWSTIKNAPIPANGLYLLPFIATFSRSAQASVENTIRKAYANGDTVAATLAELNGPRTKQGKSTQFAKIQLQANAVIETTFSHVDQISSQAIASAIFARYQWISIIDNSTTDICIERSNKIYRYGQGPIPPAHYRCRSITIPLARLLGDFTPLALYDWFKRQSRFIQRDLLGRTAADLLNSGEMTAKEFSSLQIGKPLKLSQFKSKLELILST